MLAELLLLRMDGSLACSGAASAQHGGEANLVIDLLHALEVGLRGALRSEDDVLSEVISVRRHEFASNG
jgi:hypothetical protein